MGKQAFEKIKNQNTLLTNGLMAVSYTHLDVYKRQQLCTGGLAVIDRRAAAQDDQRRQGTDHNGCLLYTSRCV